MKPLKYILLGIAVLVMLGFGIVRSEPIAERRLYAETALVRAGETAIWVVYPSAATGYRELAERIAGAIETHGGARPAVLPDTAVTEAEHPVLLEEFRGRNLILLGRLGNNRAIWGVYNRFLCAVDGYYPGGDGYVLRTAANVYRTGANTIIAGGSSDTGAACAVERLIVCIGDTPLAPDGSLVLPWLLDVQLGGECQRTFDADEFRQMARVFPSAPGEDPHESHPVKRFTENIQSWYWSGRESYLELGLRFLDDLLKEDDAIAEPRERGITGHYAAEFFIRAYNMLDDSGKLDPSRIRRVDQAILDGFDNIIGRDPNESSYRESLKLSGGAPDEMRPVETIRMESHSNSMWLADKVYADFILGAIPETAETASVHQEARVRQALYVKAFDALVKSRWREDGHDTTPMMTLFRYALEMERYGLFFDSGNARRLVVYKLARTVNPSALDIGLQRDATSRYVDYGIYAGAVALYERDGELRQVLDTLPGASFGFYGQRINGVHRYQPGPELLPMPPRSLTGVGVVPLQPVHYQRIHTDVPYEQTFNFGTVRFGFNEEDYLLLCGGADLPGNSLVRMASGGAIWLSHTTDRSPFNQNALLIRSASATQLTPPLLPPAARLEASASTAEAAYLSATLPDVSGTDWNRQIVALSGHFLLVLDTVTARIPDKFRILANWRPNHYVPGRDSKLEPSDGGNGFLEGSRWRARSETHEYFQVSDGVGLERYADEDLDPVTRKSIPVFRQRMTVSLDVGDSARVVNLLFVRKRDSTEECEVRLVGGGGVVVKELQNGEERYTYLGPLPAALGVSDAPLVVLTADRLTAFAAGTLKISGYPEILGDPPATRELEWTKHEADTLPQRLWDAAVAEQMPESAAKEKSSQIRVEPLVREWVYTGAQQPGLIAGATLVASNTWDLGRMADLCKVSVLLNREVGWKRRAQGLQGSADGRFPWPVQISPDGQVGSFVPFQGEVANIGVPVMGGYGRITLKENEYQVLCGIPQKARFVRVTADVPLQAQQLLFYDAANPDSGEPLRVQVVPLRDQDCPDLLVTPDFWPGFRDVTRLTHALHVLTPKGEERWRQEMPWRIFFTRTLDWNGTGRQSVFVGSLDNQVYVYDADGQLTDTLTVEGNARIGSPPGHHGTYGFPLASCIGLWQPDPAGRRKLVLPRYHYISFLDRDGRVEGHAKPTRCPYWINDVLETGLDFTGDGLEDSVAMSTAEIILLSQDVVDGQFPTRELPNGKADEGLLSGMPTLAFQRFDQESPLLFVARWSVVALYDLKRETWPLAWTPTTPVTAAVALPDQRQILCATRDGFLWRIRLKPDGTPEGVDSWPVTPLFQKFVQLDRQAGSVAGAAREGLFRIESDNTLVRLAEGSFHDVAVYPSAEQPEQLIASTSDGRVEAYRIAPP